MAEVGHLLRSYLKITSRRGRDSYEITRSSGLRPGQPLKIVEIDVAPPKKGEVLVKITHTGVCHTDAFTLSGDDPEGVFPAVRWAMRAAGLSWK